MANTLPPNEWGKRDYNGPQPRVRGFLVLVVLLVVTTFAIILATVPRPADVGRDERTASASPLPRFSEPESTDGGWVTRWAMRAGLERC